MTRRLLVCLVVLTAALATGGFGVAEAEPGLDSSCRTDLGTTLPVVLVHGWRSGPHAWGDLAGKLTRQGGVTPVSFDYEQHHTDWVTDAHIAPALASTIICLGKNSLLTGGPGKVVAVGHSMGGLAIRCALQASCSRVRGAQAYVAQVITVGTPTHGSFLRYGGMIGNVARMAFDAVCETFNTVITGTTAPTREDEQELCQTFLTNDAAVAFNDDSAELRALRADSTSVPVYAIAGDIKLDVGVLFGQVTVAHGDAVVDVRSQQSWSTQTGDVDCGRLLLGTSVAAFGYALGGDRSKLTNYKCWHMTETSNADVEKLITARVTTVAKQVAPPDRRSVRFDGIGELKLGMTTADLTARGFTNQGNLYEGMDAACVSYTKPGFPLSASVDTATGRVMGVRPGYTLRAVTQVGHVGVGTTLAQLRRVFTTPDFAIEEKFAADFGQGSDGVVVDGPGGSIGLGLKGDAAALASGTATVDYVAGVGTRGKAPSAMETGC